MNAILKKFVEDNIHLIEESKYNTLFILAIEQMNVTMISQLIDLLNQAKLFSWDDLDMIPDGAFMSSDISSFDIPKNIEVIGHKAFFQSNVKNMIIPETVKEIQSYSFYNCLELEDVSIEGAKFINAEAFAECPKLHHIKLPDTLIDLKYNVFKNSKNLNIDFQGTKEDWYNLTLGEPIKYFYKADILKVNCSDGSYEKEF